MKIKVKYKCSTITKFHIAETDKIVLKKKFLSFLEWFVSNQETVSFCINKDPEIDPKQKNITELI